MMRKLYIFGLVGLAALIIGLAWADQMTFTTYYPAPYGVYKEMKVHFVRVMPRSEKPNVPVGDEAKWKGKIYYNDGNGDNGDIKKGMYCYNGTKWVPLGGLGRADYDVEKPTAKHSFTPFDHYLKRDLKVDDYMVYMEGKPPGGAYHNIAIGGCIYTPAGGSEGGDFDPSSIYGIGQCLDRGAFWVNKGDNSIEVYRLLDQESNNLYFNDGFRF